jgi:hypothetical protein
LEPTHPIKVKVIILEYVLKLRYESIDTTCI